MDTMENMQFCQSCGMPLAEDVKGTEADGGKSGDYCKYCYENGQFTVDATMDEMIEMCVPHMVEANDGMTVADARRQMGEFFPRLKRWSK